LCNTKKPCVFISYPFNYLVPPVGVSRGPWRGRHPQVGDHFSFFLINKMRFLNFLGAKYISGHCITCVPLRCCKNMQHPDLTSGSPSGLAAGCLLLLGVFPVKAVLSGPVGADEPSPGRDQRAWAELTTDKTQREASHPTCCVLLRLESPSTGRGTLHKQFRAAWKHSRVKQLFF